MICEEETTKHSFRLSKNDWTSVATHLETFEKKGKDVEVTLLVELEHSLKKTISSVFELESVRVSKNKLFEKVAEIISFSIHHDPDQYINRNWSKDGDRRIIVKNRKLRDYSPVSSRFMSYRLVVLLKGLKASAKESPQGSPEHVRSESIEEALKTSRFELRPKRPQKSKSWGVYSDLKSPYGFWKFSDTIFQQVSTYKHSNVITMNDVAFYHFTGCKMSRDDREDVLETLQVHPTKNLTYQAVATTGDGRSKYISVTIIITHTGDVVLDDDKRPLEILPFNVSFHLALK